jgi:hypothetical protein
MPLSAVALIDERRTLESHLIALGVGIIGGVVVCVVGAWDVARRDVT